MIIGAKNDYFTIRSLTITKGTGYTTSDERAAAKVCVVGVTVILNLFGDENADPTGQIIRINSIPMKDCGCALQKWDKTHSDKIRTILLSLLSLPFKKE